ncbi:MAG: MBL fold metallo-hydrolase [Phycisphaeraceae bacterium]
MALKFETIVSDGISQLSYFLGDDGTRTAAVIDPRPDSKIYVDLARRHGLAITHIFETHIHADFMSGSRDLAARCPGATIYASGEGGAEYGFECETIGDGDRFELGKTVLIARHTPGHTPEHLSFLAASSGSEDRPWGVFSGDSLFAGSAGRPDLLGESHTAELEEQLFHTLRDFYLELDDGVAVHPCHGSGSACGASISDRPVTTIGYERETNPFLQIGDLDSFRAFVREGVPPVPAHYPRMKKVNAQGPWAAGHLPFVQPMTAERFREAVRAGEATLLDTRNMLAFGGGHINGAINIGGQPELSVWAGDMLDPDKPLLLVMDDDRQLSEIVALLLRTGFQRFAGYLAGGMASWIMAGYPIREIRQIDAEELAREAESVQVLDVRSDSEWEAGHVPNARHHYVAAMRGGADGFAGLDCDRPVAVYCGSGYRASIAASLLERAGYCDVRNVPGSWMAWRKHDLPVETPGA